MLKPLLLLLLMHKAVFGMESIPVKNNADFELTLSQSNYNRLLVKDDKILDVAFPKSMMGIKPDEKDGSIYVTLAGSAPFTLFLTTEAGRHFSVTVHGEEALGKTIEIVPNTAVIQARKAIHPQQENQSLISLINHMQTNQPLPEFTIQKKQQVELWSKDLKVIHQQRWEGKALVGEIIELYNGGRSPLILEETWFNQNNTRAMKFSQKHLAPKEKAFLYRVADAQGVLHHG